MTPASDPYRTLGLPRGATLDEVKRAYRALAKVNHPDAAGPAALPRWLVIQAAYEQLVHGPQPARPRATPPRPGAGSGGSEAGSGPAPGPGASRSRAGTTGATGAAGPRRSSRPAGRAGASSERGPGSDGQRGGRGRNKATLGSTSYDGADAGPFEPDWGGASWYGTTSGTYWTINPKEYADPRKHGPEYQARARRAAAGRRDAGDNAPPAHGDPAGQTGQTGRTGGAREDLPGDTPTGGPAARPEAGGPEMGGPAPTHTTSTWWRSTAGPTGTPADRAGAGGAAEPSRPAHGTANRRSRATVSAAFDEPPPPPDLAAAATDLGRALTDERTAHGRWRLVQAVVGWLPLVVGIAWLIGELTGCGRFAATCDGGVSTLTPVLGVAALGLLLLVPLLSALAAAAAVAVVVAAVPTTLLLSATGGAAELEARNAALGVVLVGAWIVGLGIGIARRLPAWRAPSGRAGPVS